jgi:hypothetical protein
MAFIVGTNTVIDGSSRFGNVGELVNALGTVTTTATINLNNGTFVTATLGGNCTFTFSNPSAGAASFSLVLTNDATAGRAITWPVSVKWPSASIPIRTTAANKIDVYTFFTVDGGTNWFGNLAQYNYS